MIFRASVKKRTRKIGEGRKRFPKHGEEGKKKKKHFKGAHATLGWSEWATELCDQAQRRRKK